MELILIRHGTTQGNLEKRFVGTLDMPLAPQGEELARKVGPTLPRVEHIYRSPLMRCRQTAELLWPERSMTVIDELRESDFGPFEGKNHEELKDDPLYQAWIGQSGDHLNFAAMPVGETAEQVVERVSVGLAKLAADAAAHGYERVGVVSPRRCPHGSFEQVRPSGAGVLWLDVPQLRRFPDVAQPRHPGADRAGGV